MFFTLGLTVDGVFSMTLSLLLAQSFGIHSALLGAGLLLASQRLIAGVMSGVGGMIVDRFGAQRILAGLLFGRVRVPMLYAALASLLALALVLETTGQRTGQKF